MVGMERTILPQLAEEKFNLKVKTAILSFIIIFGVSKAITNYFTGVLADKLGRRNLLIVGWIIALPIPFILIYAPSWSWIVFANLLLGVNQGLTWSSTVVMKIDLVGQKDRGLAMGLNEEFKPSLIAIGEVRNKFAHQPNFVLEKHATTSLYNTFASPEKELINNCVASINKTEGTKIRFKLLEAREQFIIIAVALRQILLAAVNKWRSFV